MFVGGNRISTIHVSTSLNLIMSQQAPMVTDSTYYGKEALVQII